MHIAKCNTNSDEKKNKFYRCFANNNTPITVNISFCVLHFASKIIKTKYEKYHVFLLFVFAFIFSSTTQSDIKIC